MMLSPRQCGMGLRLIRGGSSMLRKIISGFRRQDWMSVAIELVVVIAGVFIGLQVDNWNQARADARLGRGYVVRLIRDLHADRAAVDTEIAYYGAVLRSVRKTDELLREDRPAPRALIVNAYRATENNYTPSTRATWNQIVSSGHLGLLPRSVIESGLSQYYAFDYPRDVYNLSVASAYRHTVRNIIPIAMQAAIREGCSDVLDKQGSAIGFSASCTFDGDPAALAAVAARLRGNPVVAGELGDQYSLVANAMVTLRRDKGNIDNALDALGAKPAAIRTRGKREKGDGGN
jgi:hypothetical protein